MFPYLILVKEVGWVLFMATVEFTAHVLKI